MRCPRCGHENQEGDRFCSNCGARLTPVAPPRETTPTEPMPAPTPEHPATQEEVTRPPVEPRASSIPPPVTPSFASGGQRPEEPDDEWRMSSLGPPPARRRRVWLWILIAILATCVLACVALLIFASTDTGQRILNEAVSTAEAIQTQQAKP